MEKYLVLEFRNAGFFKKHKDTKDFIFDIMGKRKRKDSLCYREPITAHQISNVIHVLFGERPVPSLRGVHFGNVDYYYQKASQSYLHITSYKRTIKDKKSNIEREEFVSEFLQTKKVVNDSWSKTDFMYWERVSRYLGVELFNEFKKLLSELFEVDDITNKYSFIQLREQVLSMGIATVPPAPLTNDDDKSKKERLDLNLFYDDLVKNKKGTPLDYFFTKMIKTKKTAIVTHFIGGEKRRSEMNMAANIKVTVPTATESITKLSGEIIIPVTDDDILKLDSHKGCASILDGGLVFIKGIFNENEIDVCKHVKVSEISLEKY